MQLVTDQSIIWDPMKEKTTDRHAIKESLGLEPPQVIDMMGLSGDSSDNIPGVPGIGQKTALDLIKTFGSLENLFEQVDKITAKKQKENLILHKDQAFLSRKLAKIDTSVPISFDPEQFKIKAPDKARLFHLFKALEFRQLQQSFSRLTDPNEKIIR